MGSGGYSVTSRSVRAESLGYSTKSVNEVFSERSINSAMNPYGIGIRESRDSAEHPNSVAIIIALDETGSMLNVPHFVIKDGIPKIMSKIIQSGISDPQVMFLGIGDHVFDNAPLQVSQFESSDALLDYWLEKLYLEAGGGNNDGESYSLAHYFAAVHTSIDCWEKRKQKGILITIGDEKTLKSYSARDLQNLLGPGQYSDYTAEKLLEIASEKYEVFHLHIKETRAGQRTSTIDDWKNLLGQNVQVIEHKEDVADAIINIVLSCVNTKQIIIESTPVDSSTNVPNML